MSIKLISVNIERSKHLNRVLPFLEREEPDVLCLQEVQESDRAHFEKIMEGEMHFSAMAQRPMEDSPTGIAILSRLPVSAHAVEYYRGKPGTVPLSDETSVATKWISEHSMFTRVDVTHPEDGTYRVGTTHFTWTPDGQPDDYQRKDLAKLIPILEASGEMVFCGDFNSPRGGEIFSALAEKWQDNIPPLYKTSIDVNLHRAGHSKPRELSDKMVDGLFSTPEYFVSDVRLVGGVSDHFAIVALVSRLPDTVLMR